MDGDALAGVEWKETCECMRAALNPADAEGGE